MKAKVIKHSLSRVYLILVPLLTIIFGLGVGYISYKIYLPIWLLNVVLMVLAMWSCGASAIRTADENNKQMVFASVCFIIPTLLTSMFFGLGAPPYESPTLWVASIVEQRTRYYFLLAAGLFIAAGFAIFNERIKKTGESFYSVLGMLLIQIALPVYVLNMSFWGFYLPKLYLQMVHSNVTTIPDWVLPLRTMFYYVNVFTSALFYLGTAAFSVSLKNAQWFKPWACNTYVSVCVLFAILCLLPPSFPEPFATLNFIVSIPAVPFMFPYFIGINLLVRARKLNTA